MAGSVGHWGRALSMWLSAFIANVSKETYQSGEKSQRNLLAVKRGYME